MQLIRRQNVVIRHNIATAATDSKWSTNLGLQFIPDIVTIKLITAKAAGDPASSVGGVFTIRVDELSNYLGTFFDGSTVAPNITYDINSSVSTDAWNFRIDDATGTLNSTFDGQIVIHLEFLKYNPKSL